MSFQSDANSTYVNNQSVDKGAVRALWTAVDGIVSEVRDGRIWHTSSDNLASQTPPEGADQISIAMNPGHITYRRISAPGTVNPAIHVQTADGTWWQLSEDTRALRSNSGKSFATRAEAVAAGQAALTSDIGIIVTVEGDFVAIRGAHASADDPLFTTQPRWGVLIRLPSAALVTNKSEDRMVDNRTGWLPVSVTATGDEWTGTPDPAVIAAGVPFNADSVMVLTVPRTNTGPVGLTVSGDSYGRRVVMNSDGQPLTGGELVAGRRVALIRTHPTLRIWTGAMGWPDLRAERLSRITSVVNAGTVALDTVAGTGDAITAQVPQILKDQGISAANLRRISFVPTAANTGTLAPTIEIDGMGAVPLYTASNTVPPAGALQPGRLAEAVKIGSRWRLISGEVQRGEMDATAALLSSVVGAVTDIQDAGPHVGDEHVLAVDQAQNAVAYLDALGQLVLGGLVVDWSRVDFATMDWGRIVTDEHHVGDPFIVLGDLHGNALIWSTEDGVAGGIGSGGGSSQPPEPPGTAGNEWQVSYDGTSTRWLTQYQGRLLRLEKRSNLVLADTKPVATGILAFGGGSSLVARPLSGEWYYHLRDPDLAASSGMLAAEAAGYAMLADNAARDLAWPLVIGLTAGIGSPVEADTARESSLYQDALARIATAVTNLPAWDKTLVIDRVLLSLLGGVPETSEIAADNIYASTAANLRADIVAATGQGLPPLVVVSPSAGTREGGSSAVALAEAKLDSTHPALGFVVACPRHAYDIDAGTLATLTPASAAMLSEIEAIAVREIHGGGLWYCPRLASATRSGTTITATFLSMSDLVLPGGGDHGLSLGGDTGGVTITGVSLSGKTATITLSGVPSGTLTLNCAWGREGTPTDARPINRSDIRDQWSEPSRIQAGYTHYRLALPASVTVN
ncbi:hypothetical protein [Paracoccus kondratievae]|uniref:Uncharacterized protein n=1 Tax=Paracoccus kondratievae TaxID=135740 RepID=A0AAD3P0F8_9RHOB|nr:hypothetical protein [Paracoccus kondratievae]GLK65277.1 hypothetical protein GCM10017635_27510 [Paracoccus kondratievae]